MELYDKVRVKKENATGFIVDITDEYYAVEKEGNAGPVYWGLTEDDLEPVE